MGGVYEVGLLEIVYEVGVLQMYKRWVYWRCI